MWVQVGPQTHGPQIHTLPDFCDLIVILLHWKMHFNLLQFQSVEMHYVIEEMLGSFKR